MVLTVIALLVLCLYGIQSGRGKAFPDYISKERTNAIKGIFILVVFLSHIRPFIIDAGYMYHGIGDLIFRRFLGIFGQLMVVMFLFYSGYGVMESIGRKKDQYVKSMPRHRILSTLLNFDIAVCAFLAVDLLLKHDVTAPQFLLSLIAWDSVGNSNWYIFAILICYTVTWLAASIIKEPKQLCITVFILLTLSAVTLGFFKEYYWYNTLWAYPAGMYYSYNRPKIEGYIDTHYTKTLLILILLVAAFSAIPWDLAGFRVNALSVAFALTIVTLSMRLKMDNPALRWCGEQLFPLYIYQRIPMIVLAATLPSWMITEHPLVYTVLCLAITVLISMGYRFFRIKL